MQFHQRGQNSFERAYQLRAKVSSGWDVDTVAETFQKLYTLYRRPGARLWPIPTEQNEYNRRRHRRMMMEKNDRILVHNPRHWSSSPPSPRRIPPPRLPLPFLTPNDSTRSTSTRDSFRRTPPPPPPHPSSPASQPLQRLAAPLVCPCHSYHSPPSTPPAARPAPQLSTSHSKLVTAKLTSSAQLSASTAPGWSRPSSATPPVSATPSSSSNAPPPQPPAPAPTAPPFPHVGKVIQPQPRNAMPTSSPLVKKDSSIKPAWGNPKSLPVTSGTTPRSDFPTAAEVAQG